MTGSATGADEPGLGYFIWMNGNSPMAIQVYKHPYQLFALGKHTVTSLIQIAAERKVSVEDPLCLYERPLYRFCDNSAMEFLERNIFRYSKECYKEKQGAVRIHVARNPREEAMKAAGRVRNLVRTKGYPAILIAVVSGIKSSFKTGT